MIYGGADAEFHVEGGVVCVHAHIYTDKADANSRLHETVHEFFRWLRQHLIDVGIAHPGKFEKRDGAFYICKKCRLSARWPAPGNRHLGCGGAVVRVSAKERQLRKVTA